MDFILKLSFKSILLLVITILNLSAQHHLLNDEFNDATSLADWNNITVTEGWNAEQLEELDINTTEAGRLIMIPKTSSWYENYRGTLIYKEISGDFIFTTQVNISNRDLNGLPSSDYSLAGPMIRAPRAITNGAADWTAGGENYVFLSIGYANEYHPTLPVTPTPGPHFEVKTTTNSNSTLAVSSINTTQNVQIRIARIGDFIICLYRDSSLNWIVHRRYYRPDFPNTVQMGFVTYTDWNKVNSYDPLFHNSNVLDENLSPDPSSNPGLAFNPDLHASFDFARFENVDLPLSLVGSNLTNTSDVPDTELLAFLGDVSVAYDTPLEMELSAFLEGPYQAGGQMTIDLQESGLIPLNQPFNTAPWGYSGTESILSVPTNMTDWVLVELRNGFNINEVVAQQAAILLNDGRIVHVDYASNSAINNLVFSSTNNATYYHVVIRPRNHLALCSSAAQMFSLDPILDMSQLFNILGMNLQTTLGPDGTYLFKAGDSNGDGIIDNSDFDQYLLESSELNDYYSADFNLDKIITIQDFNLWNKNKNSIGEAVIQY